MKWLIRLFSKNWKNIEQLEAIAYQRGYSKGKQQIDRACEVSYRKGFDAGLKWVIKKHD